MEEIANKCGTILAGIEKEVGYEHFPGRHGL
jgi:hypothetical protein